MPTVLEQQRGPLLEWGEPGEGKELGWERGRQIIPAGP